MTFCIPQTIRDHLGHFMAVALCYSEPKQFTDVNEADKAIEKKLQKLEKRFLSDYQGDGPERVDQIKLVTEVFRICMEITKGKSIKDA